MGDFTRPQAFSSMYFSSSHDLASHPNAPQGGGGPGRFVQAGVLGTEGFFSTALPHPFSPAGRMVTPEKIAKATTGMAIDITQVPAIMAANSWPKGAALMRRWFAAPPHVLPDYDTPETTLITMDWVLGFDRAKTVYDGLIDERIWQNAAAQGQLAGQLKTRGVLKPNTSFTSTFGDFSGSVADRHGDHVNHRPMKKMSVFNLDDLDAALGRFSFHVLVKGKVHNHETTGYLVTIDSVGIYLKDSYDFTGEQSLGYWNTKTNAVSTFNASAGVKVNNSDFQKWRTENSRGGDFLIFSDIRELKLSKPDTFVIRA